MKMIKSKVQRRKRRCEVKRKTKVALKDEEEKQKWRLKVLRISKQLFTIPIIFLTKLRFSAVLSRQ